MEPIVQLCLIITAAGSFCYSIAIQNIVWERERALSKQLLHLIEYEHRLKTSIFIDEIVEYNNALYFNKPIETEIKK